MHSEGVVITSRHELELHLSGHDAPDGEINLADLGSIAAALQDLATRVGRYVAEQSGAGRSLAAVESAARLRLQGLARGSVTLSVALGQTDVLDIDDGLEQTVTDRLAEVIAGIAVDQRPEWTRRLVADGAITLLNALQRAATAVEVRIDHQDPVTFRPAKADRATWRPLALPAEDERRMIGRLEAVDLKSARFRLRDDVGNGIPLRHVVGPDHVAGLVGQRVAAAGLPVYNAEGRFQHLEAPTIEASPIPPEWTVPQSTDIEASIASARTYDSDDAVALTDQEFDDFMAAIKG